MSGDTGAKDWLIRDIVVKAFSADASDIHIQSNFPVFIRVHGEMKAMDIKPSRADIEDMLSLIMKTEGAIAGLYDKEEKDLSYQLQMRETTLRFRVNVSLTKEGIYVVLRRLKSVNPDPVSLGIPQQLIDIILKTSYGIIFLAGPTGCGKSTTLASLISFMAAREAVNIVTVEDPIEYELLPGKSHVAQREVKKHSKEFSTALRAAMRQDPDIILVGEVRDPDTAIAAIQAAKSGHIVFSTIHTSMASQIQKRVAGMFPIERQPWINAELLDVLVAGCVQALVPTTDGKRTLATELMISTDLSVRELLRNDKQTEVRNLMREKKIGWTLNQDLLKIKASGRISAETVTGYSNDIGELEIL